VSLAIFDFDGTITYRDSFIDFIRFYKGRTALLTGITVLFPVLILFKLKIIANANAKEIVFKYFFKNTPFDAFQKKCDDFGLTVIPKIVRNEALNAIQKHLSNGHRVIVISASAENWLIKWCKGVGVELVATHLEVKNGFITGKISGKNCYGIEKVNRLKDYLKIEDFTDIYAYGDSKGDIPMIELANHKFYRKFQ
jgi:phosphatidylglycerophosphatase C